MAPRFNKIMSKMQDEEDVPADIPNPEMYMPEPEREIAKPFPPGVAAQEAFDDMLQRRVVDPLSQAGYEDMGAGLAAIPSAAHSMIVPQTDLDVAGTIIPLPGVAKLMKKGKFKKISKAMNVEDPEHAAEIIAKQAGKLEPPARSPKETGEFDFDADMLKSRPKDDMRRRAQKDKMEYDTYKIEKNQKPKVTESQTSLDRILAKYDEPDASKLRDALKRDLESFEGGNTYLGDNYHKPVWQGPNVEYKQPIPVPPEYFDKIGNHVGKNIMSGGNDPFQWLDSKYGASKAWLEKTTGQPRTIETQSDLIAHDDYMDKLTPKDKVVFHIYTDNGRLNRMIAPGAPSSDRVLKAAQKLAAAGIDVKIVKNSPDTLKTLPNHDVGDINAMKLKDSGIKFEERNLALDEAQESRLRKSLGLENDYKKNLDDAETDQIVESERKKWKERNPTKLADPPKPPKGTPEASLLDELENEKQLYRDYRDSGDQEGIKRSLTRIKQIQDKQKTPKGDPEASSSLFPGIQSQLDVAPSRMDERGRSFGDVGQSDFIPDSRPMPRFEDVPRRNYVESEMGPSVTDMAPSYTPKQIQRIMDLKGKKDPAAGLMTPEEWDLNHQMNGGESVDEWAARNRVKDAAKSLQNQMYKGRPSFEAEQEKFGKVKEAMRGKSKYRITDKSGNDLSDMFNHNLTDEELERLLLEKIKDF